MSRLEDYITKHDFERPTLLIDLDQVAENYRRLKTGMPTAYVHYAVKSNPHPEILATLHKAGSRFDAASAGEIEMCLAAGADPANISFGNTVKRWQDIEYAYAKGIELYSADAEEELEKIARHAPGSQVFIRILMRSTEAEWPLSRKFGCSSSMAIPLMNRAKELGLEPVGLSFHVGSQTRHPHMWYDSLDAVAAIWHHAREEGHLLWLLNCGGGFPTYYGVDITEAEEYGTTLAQAIYSRFSHVPYLMIEPGRGMVGNAGAIAAEVLLVSRKTEGDPVRWVYLNVGRFNGLAETEGEAIKYQFATPGHEYSSAAAGPCILAGPTCDSADVLYEKNKIYLTYDLRAGDKFIIKSCGAYTSTYSTIAFNGFPPLEVQILPRG